MIKYFYKIVAKIYNFIFTYYEIFLLKKNGTSLESDLSINGYLKIKFDENILDYFETENVIKSNKYIHRRILSRPSINQIIEKIFIDLEVSKIISEYTNFSYSIDYLVLYKIFRIDDIDEKKDWYANHWHIDKPFSKNTLKLIVPLKDIARSSEGGMEILSKENSKKFTNLGIDGIENNSYKMTSTKKELFLFNPNLCFHRAGKIKEDYQREQIIIQLNPSKDWVVNSKIYEKQFNIEPKFPFFSYFFNKREKLLKGL